MVAGIRILDGNCRAKMETYVKTGSRQRMEKGPAPGWRFVGSGLLVSDQRIGIQGAWQEADVRVVRTHFHELQGIICGGGLGDERSLEGGGKPREGTNVRMMDVCAAHLFARGWGMPRSGVGRLIKEL